MESEFERQIDRLVEKKIQTAREIYELVGIIDGGKEVHFLWRAGVGVCLIYSQTLTAL